jgi:four helix bundle protein
MRDYKKIKAFQFADELMLMIYQASGCFPKEEMYGLTSQLRRAAISVASNITEGASRQHKRDYLHFLYISKGSLAEIEYMLSAALRLKYIPESNFEILNAKVAETAKTLTGLIQSVAQEVVSDFEPEVYSFTSMVSGLESRV